MTSDEALFTAAAENAQGELKGNVSYDKNEGYRFNNLLLNLRTGYTYQGQEYNADLNINQEFASSVLAALGLDSEFKTKYDQ